MHTAESLIRYFDLKPHPEGGFYRETYRAAMQLRGLAEFSGARSASTAIYYLLTNGARSAFHRIKSDEVWHFYDGGPLTIVEIDQHSGNLRETILGPDFTKGQTWQHVVPAGNWFGARPAGPSHSFVGCTVAPGFDFADFEMADPDTFLRKFPAAASWRELLP